MKLSRTPIAILIFCVFKDQAATVSSIGCSIVLAEVIALCAISAIAIVRVSYYEVVD